MTPCLSHCVYSLLQFLHNESVRFCLQMYTVTSHLAFVTCNLYFISTMGARCTKIFAPMPHSQMLPPSTIDSDLLSLYPTAYSCLSSSLSLLYTIFHHPPSFMILLSSRHMPMPSHPPFLDFFWDFTHFHCPPDYSDSVHVIYHAL